MQVFFNYITEHWLALSGGATALITLLAKGKDLISLAQKGWAWVSCIINGAQTVTRILKEHGIILEKYGTTLEDVKQKIEKELSPNGGGSVVDAIRRIESKMIVQESTDAAILMDYNIGIFRCDIYGKNTYVNRTYARMLKTGREDLMGHGWKNFLRRDERERYAQVWSNAFADSREFEDVVEFQDSEKKTVKVIVHGYPLPDSNNKIVGFMGMVSFSQEEIDTRSSPGNDHLN